MPVGNCHVCGRHVAGRFLGAVRCGSCVRSERRREGEKRLKELEDRVLQLEQEAVLDADKETQDD